MRLVLIALLHCCTDMLRQTDQVHAPDTVRANLNIDTRRRLRSRPRPGARASEHDRVITGWVGSKPSGNRRHERSPIAVEILPPRPYTGSGSSARNRTECVRWKADCNSGDAGPTRRRSRRAMRLLGPRARRQPRGCGGRPTLRRCVRQRHLSRPLCSDGRT